MAGESDRKAVARLDAAFVRQARATPGATALITDETPVRYDELWDDALLIAAALSAQGVGPGEVVGVHLERGRGWVASILGILRLGAAVLPVPPSYPLERRLAILAGAAPGAVVVDDEAPLPPEVAAAPLDLSTLDRDAPTAPADPGPGPDGEAHAGPEDAPAFVLSSSGTTGRPKLIVRSHRSFFHRLKWTWRTLPFQPGEVGCQKAHQTTTHGVYELFEPLLRGVPTLIVPEARVRNLEAFWAAVRDHGVTRLLLVPSMLRATLDGGVSLPDGLRAVILMGEAVPSSLARRALLALPSGTALYSIYGSTEGSSVLAADLRAVSLDDPAPPLGVPLDPRITVHVLGPDGDEVGPGGSGRLNLGGPALFDGYLGDGELTAGVLREIRGERLFDTRDDVRIGADGELHFLGRTDSTVKIRGFRVDVMEVERRLRELDGITEAVALAATAPGGESLLRAYVTPAGVDTGHALERLRATLPEHAVPSLLQAIEEFPRTPSAKVDRRRLAEDGFGGPDGAGAPAWVEGRGWAGGGSEGDTDKDDSADGDPSERGSVHGGPGQGETGRGKGSGVEAAVARSWARVLGHTAFGPDTSFFEAGGTSLSAFTLVRELRRVFDLGADRLDVTHLLADPTVTGLASRLARGEGAAGARDSSAAAPGLVMLRTGRTRDADPLFLIAAAGGTLGAYSRLVTALSTPRPVVGLEDPYLWGERDPKEPFDRWVDRLVALIRHRQPRGPYHLCAYSSAGAFGWEVTRRLEAQGESVATLVLIDPMALNSRRRRWWGWWAARCSYANKLVRLGARLAGRARAPMARVLARIADDGGSAGFREPTPGEVSGLVDGAVNGEVFLRRIAWLMELDSGTRVPDFGAEPGDGEAAPPFDRFLAAVQTVHPEADPVRLERIVRQYGVQVQYQRGYPLRPVSAEVLMFEPETQYSGMLADLVRPFAGRLRAYRIAVGQPSPRQAEILKAFMGWRIHYWCMRDETFSAGVARVLDRHLGV